MTLHAQHHKTDMNEFFSSYCAVIKDNKNQLSRDVYEEIMSIIKQVQKMYQLKLENMLENINEEEINLAEFFGKSESQP